MKKSRFTEQQIVQILKQADAGLKTADICREYGISETTYYNWKAKYGGMESSDIKRLRELEAENQRLKRMYAELSLDHQILKEIVEKSSNGRATARTGGGNLPGTSCERTSCLPDRRHSVVGAALPGQSASGSGGGQDAATVS